MLLWSRTQLESRKLRIPMISNPPHIVNLNNFILLLIDVILMRDDDDEKYKILLFTLLIWIGIVEWMMKMMKSENKHVTWTWTNKRTLQLHFDSGTTFESILSIDAGFGLGRRRSVRSSCNFSDELLCCCLRLCHCKSQVRLYSIDNGEFSSYSFTTIANRDTSISVT